MRKFIVSGVIILVVLVGFNVDASFENANVRSLGKARDPQSGKMVEGYVILHPRRASSHKPNHGGGGGGTTVSSCYTFLSRGAKWKSVEGWVFDDPASYFSNFAGDIAKWESAAGFNILGDGAIAPGLVADETSPDGVNEVMFGALSDPNTIGVTIVWGIFGGPPGGRELVEWDMVFNTAYPWSSSGETDKMDFESIATHELGHAVGLGDLYTSGCSEHTMFGYADLGETKKRTLEAGDIAGVSALY